jgi:peptide/nickel transport system ATP-binding protein
MSSQQRQQPRLQIDGLSVGYRNQRGVTVPVLRGVDLAVAPGETVGIVGESGSGKSTVALAMMGYLRTGSQVLSGRVTYGGQDLFQLTPPALRALRGGKIALIPQNAGQWLTPTMRIDQQIGEALHLHTPLTGSALRERTHELLTQVRLPNPTQIAQRYPHQLSGGQQQRVALAMALAGEPELLILDEPTTGLDVTTQAHILALLHEVAQATGAALVYVTHDWSVISRASHRVAVMYAGAVVEVGPTARLLHQPYHPYTQGLLRSIPQLQIAGLPTGIPGVPPALGSVMVGCAFAARCALADQRCRDQNPPLTTVDQPSAQHQVRCHHWSQMQGATHTTTITAVPSAKMTPSPLLVLQDVQISYQQPSFWRTWGLSRRPPVTTVQALSMTIQKGETVALVGESGSGKSTLARAVAGLLAPHAGVMQLDGVPLAPTVEARLPLQHRRIQMIFQNPDASLNPRHTVAQLLAQPLRLYFDLAGPAIRERSRELLQQVRLGEQYLTRFPAQLSGGEKQRVAIARAFAAEPDLILCDEVVSALDVSVQATVLELLARLQAERGVAYLFIAHDLAVVRAIADQVAVLYQGHLCEVGAAAQVYAAPHHPYTALLLQAAANGESRQPKPTVDTIPAWQGRGCPVQAICPHHLGRLCAETPPPWQTTDSGHRIRCHLPIAEL